MMKKFNWYYGWNIVGLSILFQAVTIGVVLYVFSLLVLPFSEELGTSRSKVVFIFTMSSIVSALLSPLVGKAIDQLSIRTLLCSGLLLGAIGAALLSVAEAYWQIMFLYCTFLAAAMVLAGTLMCQSLIARWFIARRGSAMGISSLGTTTGGFIFPLVAGFLIPEIGWRQTMVVLSVCLLVTIPIAWLLLAKEPDEETLAVEKKRSSKPDDVNSQNTWTTTSLLRSRHFWIVNGLIVTLPFAFVGVQVNLAVFAQDSGYSSAQGGALLSTLLSTMLIGKLVYGFLSDRLSQRILFMLVYAGYITGILGLQLSFTLPFLFIATGILGFSSGSMMPVVGTVVSNLYGVASFGTVMGLVSLSMMVGSSTGPLVVSLIQELTNSYTTAFSAVAGIMALASVLIFFLPTEVTNQQSIEATS